MESNASIPSEVVTALRQAQYVTILTGAGISAESGLATFRDALTGLWEKFRPEDLATPEAFLRNPRLVWEWYATRREKVQAASPNPGHLALAEMERHVPSFELITQNVDGLHQRAGSVHVTELHGNLARVKCFEHNHPALNWDESGELPPRCQQCGSLLRPDVVWFGETLPQEAFAHAVEAATRCDLFFSIGTSGMVEPAASLARVARKYHATVVVINLDKENLSGQKYHHLHAPAGQILPALVQAAWPSA